MPAIHRAMFTKECPDCGREVKCNHWGQTLHECEKDSHLA
jgi:hypothetical protein